MEARSSPRGRLEVQITAGATFMLPSSLPRCSATDTARGRGAALHSPHSGRRPEGQRVPRARLPRGWQQQEGAAPDSHMGAADLRKQVPRPRSAGHRSHTRTWPRAGAGSERSLGKNPNSRHLTLGAPRTVRDTEKGFLRVQAQGRTSLGRAHTRFAMTGVSAAAGDAPLRTRRSSRPSCFVQSSTRRFTLSPSHVFFLEIRDAVTSPPFSGVLSSHAGSQFRATRALPQATSTHTESRARPGASGQAGCQRATGVATRLPGRRHSGDGEAPGQPPAMRLQAGKAPN